MNRTKIFALAAAFVTLCGASSAFAATLASLEISGDFEATIGSENSSFIVRDGSFEALLLTNDIDTVHDLVLGLAISIDGTPVINSQNVDFVTDSLAHVYHGLQNRVASDPNLSGALNYILGNPMGTLQVPDSSLSYYYTPNTNQPANGLAGTFGFALGTTVELPILLSANASGRFDIYATISSADVPLPASFPLLGMAFGGLMVLRKRRPA